MTATSGTPRSPGLTYKAAGVDIEAADAAVERIKAHVASTNRPEVLSGLGGFGGLFAPNFSKYRQPVLVSTTDGVGTKSEVARMVGRYDTIGIDCVAMSVDDLATCGAEPLFFLDYLSVGRADPDLVESLVSGVADGCRQAGCALIGGEISEHPGVIEAGAFDLVGFAVGLVERDETMPRAVTPGDVVVGLASPGLRSNGYSLARKVLLEHSGRRIDEAAWPGADRTLGEELLIPSVIYSPALRRLAGDVDLRAAAHVTGGGIPGNLNRVLSSRTAAVVQRGSWPEPRIFSEIQAAGGIDPAEMAKVFNLGLGMLAVVASGDAPAALASIEASGHGAYVVGRIVEGAGEVEVEGTAG